MPHSSRIVSVIPAALLALALCPPAVAAEDHAFYHENVHGHVARADAFAPTARRPLARPNVASSTEIDRLAAIFSGYDPASEFSRWQAAPRTPLRGLARALRCPRGVRTLGSCQRRRVRPQGRGAVAALGAVLRQRPAADRRRNNRRAGPLMTPRLATGPRRAHGRAAVGLPAQSQRDRQGLHRRTSLRSRVSRSAGVQRVSLERRRRPARARRHRPHDRHRRPLGRLGIVRTSSFYRSRRTGRSPPAANPVAGFQINGQMVLSCL